MNMQNWLELTKIDIICVTQASNPWRWIVETKSLTTTLDICLFAYLPYALMFFWPVLVKNTFKIQVLSKWWSDICRYIRNNQEAARKQTFYILWLHYSVSSLILYIVSKYVDTKLIKKKLLRRTDTVF